MIQDEWSENTKKNHIKILQYLAFPASNLSLKSFFLFICFSVMAHAKSTKFAEILYDKCDPYKYGLRYKKRSPMFHAHPSFGMTPTFQKNKK